MSQWVERIEGHQAFTELRALEQVLESSKEACHGNQTLLDHWDRAQHITQYIRSVLGRMDPLLVSLSVFNNMASSLQQAKAQITAFQGNKNVGHWDNAQPHLENCVSYLSAIPRAMTLPDVEDLRESASSYRRSISRLLKGIQDEGNQVRDQQATLKTRLNEFNAEIAAQKQRLDAAIATFQQQFSEAQQTRQNDFSTAEKLRVTTFSSSEEARELEFTVQEEKRSSRYDSSLESIKLSGEQLNSSLKSAAGDLIAAMKANKDHAEKIVGIISDTGMVHGYQKTANEERNEAKIWKKVATWSLISWIVISVVFFFLTYDKELTWPSVARQLLISTPFVLLAGFAALQVTRHQKAERQLRQAELEIASIDPFLATLSDEERNQVKRDFAARNFGQRELDNKQVDVNNKLVDLFLDVSKTLRETQQALRK